MLAVAFLEDPLDHSEHGTEARCFLPGEQVDEMLDEVSHGDELTVALIYCNSMG